VKLATKPPNPPSRRNDYQSQSLFPTPFSKRLTRQCVHAMDVLKDLDLQPLVPTPETCNACFGLRDAEETSNLSHESCNEETSNLSRESCNEETSNLSREFCNPEPGGACAPWRCPTTSSPANGAGYRGRLCRPSSWILILDITAEYLFNSIFLGIGEW
jgi:hypothetical protein